ncbi:hypothetical protein ACTA71_007015 [Dictyostelium dimigraforme]
MEKNKKIVYKINNFNGRFICSTVENNKNEPFISKFLFENQISIVLTINLILLLFGGFEIYNKTIHSLFSIFINPIFIFHYLFVILIVSFLNPILTFINHFDDENNNNKNKKILLIFGYIIIQFIQILYFTFKVIKGIENYYLGTIIFLVLFFISIILKSHSFFVSTNFEDPSTIGLKEDKKSGESFLFSSFILEYKNSFQEISIYEYIYDFFLFLISPTLIYEHYFIVKKSILSKIIVSTISKTIKKKDSIIFLLVSIVFLIIIIHYINLNFICPILMKYGITIKSILIFSLPIGLSQYLYYYLAFVSFGRLFNRVFNFNDDSLISGDFLTSTSITERYNLFALPISQWIKKHCYYDFILIHELIVLVLFKRTMFLFTLIMSLNLALLIFERNYRKICKMLLYKYIFVQIIIHFSTTIIYLTQFYFLYPIKQ